MYDVLAEIYRTIIPSAPYIIAAYALVIVALFVYVFIVWRATKRAEATLEVLEEALNEKDADEGHDHEAACRQ